MAIYTRRGDQGKTSLYNPPAGGNRRWKYDQRVVSIGTIDELNSQLGMVSSLLSKRTGEFKNVLRQIQQDLFEIGAELATPKSQKPPFSITLKRVREIEGIIDDLEGELPALGNFIFPGGSSSGAALHVARSISRRAEREVARLSRKEKVNTNLLVYLNRLSDLLFMLARKVNAVHKTPEDHWKGK